MKLSRHSFIWSYRLDIFGATLVVILITFSVVGAVLVRDNNHVMSVFQDSPLFEEFKTNRAKILDLGARFAKNPDLTDEERETLRKVLDDIPIVKPSTDKQSPMNFEPTVYLSLVSPQIRAKLASLAIAEQFWANQLNQVTLLTSTSWTLWWGLCGFVIAIFIASRIYNVFYFYGKECISNHPYFAIVFIQIITVSVAPLAACIIIDHFYLDKIREVESNFPDGAAIRSLPYGFWRRINEAGSALLRTSHDESAPLTSDIAAVVFPFAAWLSAWLCIGRRVKEDLFVWGTVVAGAVFVLLTTTIGNSLSFTGRFDITLVSSIVHLTVSDFGMKVAAALFLFSVVYIAGVLMPDNPRRLLLISIGYLGSIVYAGGCLGLVVGTWEHNIIGLAGIFVVVCVATLVLDLIMEGVMYRVVYQPRP